MKKIYKALLSERDSDGKIPHHPYDKWLGAHWVLSLLADLDYPSGDLSLLPLREQVFEWIFSPEVKVQVVNNLSRRCASQEGNVLYYLVKLGIDDERCDELAKRLMLWQWPDGGWNCDLNPLAHTSSFYESLIPLRGLNIYKKRRDSVKLDIAIAKSLEFFLSRRLFKKLSDGSVINPDFLKLHYPCYWRYDILFALKVMQECGKLDDIRCQDALNILKSKRLSDGGFPADEKYYNVADSVYKSSSLVDWGDVSSIKRNEFVTRDAMSVLKSINKSSHS